MIYGVQKLSLVDYPETPSFVIFLGGCNFRCPYCYNKSIVDKTNNQLDTNDVINQIKERKTLISGIVVTGGEPTVHGDKLIDLLITLKELNLKIKLDTNGTNPALLKKIINMNLIDYIAMDIKNIFAKYDENIGIKTNIENIKRSITLIEDSTLLYEFRTTINKTFHNKEDIKEIASYLKDPSKLYLQPYQYNENQLVDKHYEEYSEEEIEQIAKELKILAKI